MSNLVLGDFYAEAWRANYEHPPLMKWVLSIGDVLGGLDGARVEGAVLSALAAALLFVFGRLTFGRRVGAVAGALAVFLPLWVAYGRIVSHESVILVWWTASMLAVACWMESGRKDRVAAFGSASSPRRRGSSRGRRWSGSSRCSSSRGSCNHAARSCSVSVPFRWRRSRGGASPSPSRSLPGRSCGRTPTRSSRAFPARGGSRGATSRCTWGSSRSPLGTTSRSRSSPRLRRCCSLLALVGIALALGRGAAWKWVVVCLAWLVVPFGQSLSTLRIGAGRYVMPAWPALLLFAAVSLVAAGDFLGDLAFDLSKRVAPPSARAPAVLAVAYTGLALLRVEPYPLDYFNELVGGPAGVAARKMFEVPWWGEGNLAAVRTLNRVAPDERARAPLPLARARARASPRGSRPQVEDPTAGGLRSRLAPAILRAAAPGVRADQQRGGGGGAARRHVPLQPGEPHAARLRRDEPTRGGRRGDRPLPRGASARPERRWRHLRARLGGAQEGGPRARRGALPGRRRPGRAPERRRHRVLRPLRPGHPLRGERGRTRRPPDAFRACHRRRRSRPERFADRVAGAPALDLETAMEAIRNAAATGTPGETPARARVRSSGPHEARPGR